MKKILQILGDIGVETQIFTKKIRTKGTKETILITILFEFNIL